MKIHQETIEAVKKLYREGVSRKEISERLGVSRSTVHRALPVDKTRDKTFSQVEGNTVCTYRLVMVEPLPEVLDESSSINTSESQTDFKSQLIEGAINYYNYRNWPMIDDKLRQIIKARALDTFNGFEGGLEEMAQKAVSHAIKETTVNQ